MHNPTLPLVLPNMWSRKADEVAFTLCGLALTPKKTTAIDRIDRLAVYRNPQFGSATRPKPEANLKQSWLPVITTPTMNGIYLEDEAKSNSIPTAIAGGQRRPKSSQGISKTKYESAARRAQLRYNLLVRALVGMGALLYGFLLDVLISGKQNHHLSAPTNPARPRTTSSTCAKGRVETTTRFCHARK